MLIGYFNATSDKKSSVESIDFATSFTLLHSKKRAMANLFVVAVPPSSLMGG